MTRILIVDDKEENLYYLRVLLSAGGAVVEEARHGAEALVKARQNPPDLVISDLLMPVMDGYTLLRYWKADTRLQRVPFVVYTATYTEPEDERLALSLGADAFILKPTEPEVFLERIRRIQADAALGVAAVPQKPMGDETTRLKSYSETLIRKLEHKTLQLEETNQSLQRDIAERRAVEAALRKSEEEFRLLAETMPQISCVAQADGAHLHFAQKWMDYTGLSLAESLGNGWVAALHPDDRALVSDRWRGAVESGGIYEVEYRLRRVDGTFRWMLGRALPLRDAAGAVLKWFGTCTDIDELKQAQVRIGEQAALLNQTQDAIVVVDLQHRVLFWNRGAERLYGWSATEAIGRIADELIRCEPEPLAVAKTTLGEKGEWNGEMVQRNKAGAELVVEGRWAVVRDPGGKAKSVLTINTDVTARKQMENQFLRAQRMESIGTLAGGIAHDLNNLLTPISMGVDLLRMLEANPDSMQVIDTIDRSAKRGAEIVRQVLSFARGVEGSRVALQVGHVVREVGGIVSNTFPKNIAFTARIDPDLWLVQADPTRLHQVLLNLCVNARDAMPKGGRLVLSAANVLIGEPTAAANPGATAGRHVVLTVVDSGCGMRRETIERIFEPFFTTKELGKGTGLGLSTVMGIVRGHGGFVNVESEPGAGSTFRVYLPAQPDGAVVETEGTSEVPYPRGQGELILVVDDELAILDVTRRTLESVGYKVVTAVDGAEAISLFARHRGQIAAVLTDMMMPLMDGTALIAALRYTDASVRIIAVSGLPEGERRPKLEGVAQFLSKPFSAGVLLTTLRAVLTKERSVPGVPGATSDLPGGAVNG